jgi:hypothetical protein
MLGGEFRAILPSHERFILYREARGDPFNTVVQSNMYVHNEVWGNELVPSMQSLLPYHALECRTNKGGTEASKAWSNSIERQCSHSWLVSSLLDSFAEALPSS